MAWQAFARRTLDGDGHAAHLLECGHVKAPHESRHGVPYARQWCSECAGQKPKPKVERVWISRSVAKTALQHLEAAPKNKNVETAIAGLRGALHREDQT